jgi:hypothetical protein
MEVVGMECWSEGRQQVSVIKISNNKTQIPNKSQ